MRGKPWRSRGPPSVVGSPPRVRVSHRSGGVREGPHPIILATVAATRNRILIVLVGRAARAATWNQHWNRLRNRIRNPLLLLLRRLLLIRRSGVLLMLRSGVLIHQNGLLIRRSGLLIRRSGRGCTRVDGGIEVDKRAARLRRVMSSRRGSGGTDVYNRAARLRSRAMPSRQSAVSSRRGAGGAVSSRVSSRRGGGGTDVNSRAAVLSSRTARRSPSNPGLHTQLDTAGAPGRRLHVQLEVLRAARREKARKQLSRQLAQLSSNIY